MEYYNYDFENELYHHGILGMKWGVRRFQNSDGSLKPAGEKRYGSGKTIGQRIKDHKVAVRRKKNLEKARQARIEKKKAEEEAKKTAEERAKLIAKGKIRPKDMTTDELKQRIERLDAERRLKDLERQTFEASKGKKFVDTLMTKVITPAATSAGEQFLRKYLNDVGDDILSGLKDAKAAKDPNKRLLAEIDKLKNEHTKLDYQKKIADLKKTNDEKEKFDLDELWKNKDSLSDKQINDISQRLSNEQKIENIRKQREKEAQKKDNKKKEQQSNDKK